MSCPRVSREGGPQAEGAYRPLPTPRTERAPSGVSRTGAGGSWLPQPEGWGELSVEAQTGEPDSTLELYRSTLAVRR
ncbi:hypothetical protein ACWGP2_24145, partial [Streptomyces sp. NPDC055699]